MADFIKAYAASDIGAPSLPDSLEWMPAGEHEISATRGGKPVVARVITSPEDAVRLNEQLQASLKLAAEGKASRPYIDFNHDGKDAAAIPVEFYWENGIRLKVEWTKAGSEAIAGRTFSYFSPEFMLGQDGHPKSIPDVGPIGALVNTPAFQSIQRLAAAHNKTAQTMKEIAKALGLPEDATVEVITAALAGLQAKAKELETVTASLNAITKERDELATKAKAAEEAALAVEVDAHIAAKRVKEDQKAYWISALKATPAETRKVLASLSSPAPAAGVAPVKAEKGNESPDKLQGEALLAHYRSLKGKERDEFFSKNKDAIWAAYSNA